MPAPPIYVINLARRPDRMAAMARRLTEAGLAFTRIEAIDAAETAPGWMEAQFAPPGRFGRLSPPEQACALSHFKALECFLSTPEDASGPHAVIFEDDVRFSPQAGAMLSSLDWLAPSTQLLKIERERGRVLLGPARAAPAPHPAFIAPLRWDHTCTAGYIVSRSAAQALVSLRPKPTLPYDFLLFNPAVSPMFRRLRPEQLLPPLVEQTTPSREDSDIESSRAELNWKRSHPQGAAKVRREVLRVWRQAAQLAAQSVGAARWTTIEPLTPGETPP